MRPMGKMNPAMMKELETIARKAALVASSLGGDNGDGMVRVSMSGDDEMSEPMMCPHCGYEMKPKKREAEMMSDDDDEVDIGKEY